MNNVKQTCLSCNKEMRTWYGRDKLFVAMCITEGCDQKGIVYQALTSSLKIDIRITI